MRSIAKAIRRVGLQPSSARHFRRIAQGPHTAHGRPRHERLRRFQRRDRKAHPFHMRRSIPRIQVPRTQNKLKTPKKRGKLLRPSEGGDRPGLRDDHHASCEAHSSVKPLPRRACPGAPDPSLFLAMALAKIAHSVRNSTWQLFPTFPENLLRCLLFNTQVPGRYRPEATSR